MAQTIYLDNNATTKLDERVLDAMVPVYKEHFGNPESTTHPYGWFAEELVSIAREEISEAIRSTPEEIIFTSGATEANNLALFGSLHSYIKSSRPAHVISCVTEHSSVLEPLERLKSQGIDVTLLEVSGNGSISLEALKAALRDDTVLVSLMLANNEIGTIHDLHAVSSLVKPRGILVHTDATQALGKISISTKSLGVDLLSLSAHKAHGPKGVGALFIKQSVQRSIEAQLLGGGHEHGLRAGTLNVPGIVGFGKASFYAQADLTKTQATLQKLSRMFLDGLTKVIPGVYVNGPLENRLPGNLNLALDEIPAVTLVAELKSRVAFSLGSACQAKHAGPSHVIKALGLEKERMHESFRIGISKFTTEDEIFGAVQAFTDAAQALRSHA
ncbi:cysteine desulfurase [bacterium]|nr:cysteine desulfurase [bacterium]